MHVNTSKISQNRLIKYITNLNNVFENKIFRKKKYRLLLNEQNNYETLIYIYKNCEKKSRNNKRNIIIVIIR